MPYIRNLYENNGMYEETSLYLAKPFYENVAYYISLMTKEKFDSYVKHYLELSKNKSLNDDKIVRISHTSFTQYERKMKYAIAYLQDELCSNYFKTKIRKLREHK